MSSRKNQYYVETDIVAHLSWPKLALPKKNPSNYINCRRLLFLLLSKITVGMIILNAYWKLIIAFCACSCLLPSARFCQLCASKEFQAVYKYLAVHILGLIDKLQFLFTNLASCHVQFALLQCAFVQYQCNFGMALI